jgi:hypothetical protein
MLVSLARNRAWSDSIDDEVRAKVVAKLRAGLELADDARDITAVAKALSALERNDIERTRLLMDAEDRSSGTQNDAAQLLDDIAAMRRTRGERGPA